MSGAPRTVAPGSAVLPPRRARLGVSLLFLCNGAVYANLIPRLPEVQERLGLTDGDLGVAFLGVGAGAMVGSLVVGLLVDRFTSRRTVLVGGAALAVALPLAGVAPSLAALGGALALLALADVTMDVAMNAHGVVVEARYRRAILSGFHGWWSVGSLSGALLGAAAAGAGMPVGWHLTLVGLGAVVLLVAVRPTLLADAGDEADRPPVTSDAPGLPPAAQSAARALLSALRGPVLLVGACALLSAVIEDTTATWSAIYLRNVVGASAGVAGLGFAVLALAMTAARLVADRISSRLGPARTARVGALIAAAGMTLVLATGTLAGGLLGFALLGVGVAPLFPLAFSAAGRVPGVRGGVALGGVSFIARIGFFAAPPLVGLASDAFGLRRALLVVVVAAIGMVVVAPWLEPGARGRARSTEPA